MNELAPSLQFPAADAAVRERRPHARPLLAHEFDWTEERVDTLKRMWDAGKSQAEIADAIGCPSRSAIGGKIHRLGISRQVERKPKPPRPERQRGRPARTYLPQCDAEPFESRAVLPEGRLTFAELTNAVCHFPVGAPPYLFCGEPAVAASSYCASCRAIASLPRGG